MNDKIIAVMGYPDRPNKDRFKFDRTTSTKSNDKNTRKEQ